MVIEFIIYILLVEGTHSFLLRGVDLWIRAAEFLTRRSIRKRVLNMSPEQRRAVLQRAKRRSKINERC